MLSQSSLADPSLSARMIAVHRLAVGRDGRAALPGVCHAMTNLHDVGPVGEYRQRRNRIRESGALAIGTARMPEARPDAHFLRDPELASPAQTPESDH
jgi:hypothetical protein